MGENTNIEWADHTFNPWIGCTKISAACDNCYAEALAKRFGMAEWGNKPRKRTSESYWKNPLRWQRDAEKFFEKNNRRQRVFCASLSDVFDNQVDPSWREDLWEVMRQTPDLDWLLLTKRPRNIAKMLPKDFDRNLSTQTWLGITIENQAQYDAHCLNLRTADPAVWFFSCEPLLSEIEFNSSNPDLWPDWVICGGESGPNARLVDKWHVLGLRAECEAKEVPFFFKQWGDIKANPYLDEADSYGKGGGLIDGELVREFPKVK